MRLVAGLMLLPSLALADVKASVEKAEKSYFAAQLDAASALLDQAEKEEMASDEISPHRARIHLVRAAILSKQGNAAGAEGAARKALRLDPELDASVFPPAVQEIFGRVKQALPARVVVKVIDVPPGAAVRVDGRAIGAAGIVTVVPGSHQLAIRIGGKTSLKTFDATENLDLSAGGAVAAATPAATPTPVAIATPRPSPTPRVATGGGGRKTAGYALAAVAVTGAGAAGHGYWARSISLENQKRTATQKDVYDDDIQKFTTQTAAGGGLALLAGGLAVWLLSSKSGASAYVAPTEDGGAAVGFSIEFGGDR